MNTNKRLSEIIISLVRIFTYLMIFAVFVFLLAINNPALIRPSRTSAITLSSYAVFLYLFFKIRGGYRIGLLKSKPIIAKMTVSVFLADILAYLQLEIMNVNSRRNSKLILFGNDLWLLIFAFLLQTLFIVVMTYLGNELYFKLYKPKKCLVITESEHDTALILKKLRRFAKQFAISDTACWQDNNIYERIDKCEVAVLFRLPAQAHQELVEYCYSKRKDVYFDTTIGDILAHRSVPMVMDDVLITAHVRDGLTLTEMIVKRIFDIIVSLILTVLFSPVMIGCAIAIKIDDGGHVFFRQERVTRNGKLFKIYKFRTMRENSDPTKPVTADDNRITRVGKYMRRFRLDELPQFFNILIGDMSVVGPRPEMLSTYNKYVAEYPQFAYRSRVKSGLTGNAQILGKYNTQPREKLIMDIAYIENYSLWEDIRLVLRTITVFLKSDSTESFENNPLTESKENKK